jgi:hypothetical protein
MCVLAAGCCAARMIECRKGTHEKDVRKSVPDKNSTHRRSTSDKQRKLAQCKALCATSGGGVGNKSVRGEWWWKRKQRREMLQGKEG